MEKRKRLIERFEEKITIRRKSTGYAGLIFLFSLFFILIIFVSLRGFRGMESVWPFTIGVNLIAYFVCSVLYSICLEDSAGVGEENALFLSLLIASGMSMFWAACCWIVQGIAPLAFWNRLANVLLYFNNFMMLFLFWRCELFMLEIDEKLDRFVNNFMYLFMITVLILILANSFVPVFFSVNKDGFYQRTAFFPLIFIMMLPVFVLISVGIITAKSSKREKLIVASFIGLPLIAFLITLVNPDISLLEPAMFLSVMLIYLMLINERGKKLTVTQTELRTATEIQNSMLPHIFPPFPERDEFDLFASMDPAREVGGDFYDFFLIDDEHLAILIADVSDKGVPAALFMMSAKILINYRARQGGSPAEILTDINAQIARNNESKMFITIWMGILELKTGRLICTNAGHEYPVICGPDGVFRIFRDKHGLCAGAMENIRYRDYELILQPGDKIFVYTDGVPETNNSDGEFYGLNRLEAALNRLTAETPENILAGIRKEVDAFMGDAKQFDDLTMLCLEYRGSAKQTSPDQ